MVKNNNTSLEEMRYIALCNNFSINSYDKMNLIIDNLSMLLRCETKYKGCIIQKFPKKTINDLLIGTNI